MGESFSPATFVYFSRNSHLFVKFHIQKKLFFRFKILENFTNSDNTPAFRDSHKYPILETIFENLENKLYDNNDPNPFKDSTEPAAASPHSRKFGYIWAERTLYLRCQILYE